MVAVQEECDLLILPPGVSSAGEAFYRKGELHRIQGEYSLAEDAYQEANKWGLQPQPGMARLKLAQGDPEAAKIMIRHLYDEKRIKPGKRGYLLLLLIECLQPMKSIWHKEAARELTEIVDEIDAPFLRLTAAGESKKKIAELFFISERTVERNVSIIFPKLTPGPGP